MYSASKHAVKGFTDVLRVEIEEVDQAPVSITLIQPTAVDTPFPQHARNYQRQEPKLPDPMIDPRQVAEAILAAAVKPIRATKVGLMSKVNTTLSKLAPGISDKIASKQADRQHYDEPPRYPEGALQCASETTGSAGQIHGSGGNVKR
jgi:short-subunit dehydrogenase